MYTVCPAYFRSRSQKWAAAAHKAGHEDAITPVANDLREGDEDEGLRGGTRNSVSRTGGTRTGLRPTLRRVATSSGKVVQP